MKLSSRLDPRDGAQKPGKECGATKVVSDDSNYLCIFHLHDNFSLKSMKKSMEKIDG